MEFRWEPLSYLLDTGLHQLAERHWNEVGYDKDLLKYNPNWPQYKAMEDQNILRWMALRIDGALVGYASVIITQSLHDRDVCCAIVQDFYLAPEHRKGFAGVKIFWVLETQLKALGVKHIAAAERIMTAPEERSTSKLFEYLGFHSDERIWTKSIGGHA